MKKFRIICLLLLIFIVSTIYLYNEDKQFSIDDCIKNELMVDDIESLSGKKYDNAIIVCKEKKKEHLMEKTSLISTHFFSKNMLRKVLKAIF